MVRKIFRNIYLLPLSLLIVVQSCKSENPHRNTDSSKTAQPVEKYCYVNNIWKIDGKTHAAVDFIEYLKIAGLDSTPDKSEIIELPNGFGFLNRETKLQKFIIAQDAEIIMQTLSYDSEGNFNFNQAVKLDELVRWFAEPDAERIKLSPFKITLKGDEIISLKEIYIP